MTALFIIGGIIGWILIGLRSIAWMINTTAKIHGYRGEEPEIRFADFFKIRCGEDFIFFLGFSVVAVFWPIILMFVVEAWREHTRKIRGEAKHE